MLQIKKGQDKKTGLISFVHLVKSAEAEKPFSGELQLAYANLHKSF